MIFSSLCFLESIKLFFDDTRVIFKNTLAHPVLEDYVPVYTVFWVGQGGNSFFFKNIVSTNELAPHFPPPMWKIGRHWISLFKKQFLLNDTLDEF